MRRLTTGLTAALAIGLLAYATVAQPTEPGGRPGRRRGQRPGGAAQISTPMPKTDAEKKILAVLDDMFKTQRQGMQNVPTQDGRLLRVLAETTGAKHVVEIGTSNGYSGTWICLGLLNTGGKLTTHEIDPQRAAKARENFKRAGVDKIATVVEGDAHDEIAKLKGPIDIVFLDADKEGYADYLKKLLPLVRPGGLIVAHNVASQAGAMKDYLKAVTTNPDLETITVNVPGTGVGVTLKKR